MGHVASQDRDLEPLAWHDVTIGSASAVRSGAAAGHESLHAVHGLDDLLVGGCVAHPHMAGARWPKSHARDDRYPLLGEQALREGLLVEAGGIGHVREAVEGAPRLEAVEAHFVEAPGHQQPAPVVLLEHALDEGLAGADRL